MVLNNLKEIVFILSYSSLFPCVINQALIPVVSGEEKGLNKMEKGIGSKWPTGKIPYFFDVKSYDFLVAYKIRMNMNMLESSSCIQFVPMQLKPTKKSDSAWIHITNPNKERECMHEVEELPNGENVLVLGYDCLTSLDILRSLLHAMGFHDEVTHPYRDKYIRVQWNNIQPRYRKLYNIRPPTKLDIQVEYDPLSVMQFGDRDFSVNGQATIEPLLSGMIISPSKRLSQLDQLKLNLYFGDLCNKRDVKQLLQTCKNALLEDRGLGNVNKLKNNDSDHSNDIYDDDTYDDKNYNGESSEEDSLSGLKGKDLKGESSEDDALSGLKGKNSKGESSEDNVLNGQKDEDSKKGSSEDDKASDLKDKDSKEESSEDDLPVALKDKYPKNDSVEDYVPRGLKYKYSKKKLSKKDVSKVTNSLKKATKTRRKITTTQTFQPRRKELGHD